MYFVSVLQLYILLVVRSEIIKLNKECQFRFANIGSEAECTMTIEGSTNANMQQTKDSKIKRFDKRGNNARN